MLTILLLVPFRGSTDDYKTGNQITAERWARLLGHLGFEVTLGSDGTEGCFDFILALHAVRCHEAIKRNSERCGKRPLAVVLTGTDLHTSSATDRETMARSLELADRIVVLHDRPVDALPMPNIHVNTAKVRVIHQSAQTPTQAPTLAPGEARSKAPAQDGTYPSEREFFTVVQLAHLRAVKQPFLIAQAVERLPSHSRVRVFHAGAELTDGYRARAEQLSNRTHRYHYLGPLSHRAALSLLSTADLMVLLSKSEGGANVVSEALVADVPILTTPTDGALGLLGEDFPGYVPFAELDDLRGRLCGLEDSPEALGALRDAGRRRAARVNEASESARLSSLMAELGANPE